MSSSFRSFANKRMERYPNNNHYRQYCTQLVATSWRHPNRFYCYGTLEKKHHHNGCYHWVCTKCGHDYGPVGRRP